MLKYAIIVNKTTKQVDVALGNYIPDGFSEMDVEEAYNGSWYLKGYAPSKPEAVINEEKVAEARKYLQETDYIWNVIREGDATEEHYTDIIAKRKEARELIRSLENN